MSCATASICVATDAFGNVLSTTAPTAGVDGWRTTAVDSAGDADAVALGPVSCSPGLCVTDDRGGNVIASSDPMGGAQEWTTASVPIALDRHAELSCPTSHLCVVVDGDDEILSSTDPTAGAGAWSATRLGAGHVISAVSCPTSSLCVATDNSGSMLTSANPIGGAGAWTATPLPPGHYNLWAISCPTLTLCAAVDHDSGDLLSSSNPTGGSGAWSLARIMPSNRSSLLDISCAASTLCVATDDAGAVHTSSDPTAGSRAWTSTFIDGVADTALAGILRGVSCPTRDLCVAVDQAGNALTSTDPAGPVAAATRPAIEFASLAGVRNARPKLSFTVTAGIPPAGELAQLALTLPRGIGASANGKKLRAGIRLRRPGGTRIPVVGPRKPRRSRGEAQEARHRGDIGRFKSRDLAQQGAGARLRASARRSACLWGARNRLSGGYDEAAACAQLTLIGGAGGAPEARVRRPRTPRQLEPEMKFREARAVSRPLSGLFDVPCGRTRIAIRGRRDTRLVAPWAAACRRPLRPATPNAGSRRVLELLAHAIELGRVIRAEPTVLHGGPLTMASTTTAHTPESIAT